MTSLFESEIITIMKPEIYTQEIRVNGVTVEVTGTDTLDNMRLYERLLKRFFNHLKIAFTEPDNFEFDGYGGKMNAGEFISFHQNRLKSDLKGNIELVFNDQTVDSFNTSQIIDKNT